MRGSGGGGVVVVLAAIALASPAPVSAQSPGAPAEERATLDEPIDIALKDAAPAEVFASFAHILGLQVAALPAFDRTLTMELHGVRAETVLTAACESLGCAWRIKGAQLVVTGDPDAPAPPSEPRAGAGDAVGPLDEAIDIVLKDADLRETLRSFGTITRARVEIDPALEGRVTLALESVPLREALDAICGIQKCRWRLEEMADGPVLRFTPR